MAVKKIIRDYTPNKSALDTLDEQIKCIQDLYDQVREFYNYLSSPDFNASIKGDKGDKGDQGERGIQGIPGAKGQDGIVGPQGPRGIQGETGPRGSDGAPGVDGLPGERGPAGPSGPRGLTGPVGAKGEKGEKGDKGDIGASYGLVDVQNTYADLVEYSPRVNAGFYLVAGRNKENGDVYVYREKYGDFVFLNNVIYDLFFQLMQAPPGRNYLTLTKGEHCDEYGTIDIIKEESIDTKGYLHTNFILNYLKGNGVKSTKWTEDTADSHTSTLEITFDNGDVVDINVKNGKGISSIEKTGTNVLVDTYTITYSNGSTKTYTITNGRGITNITKTSTSGYVDTYTITFNDNTTTTFTVTNGRAEFLMEEIYIGVGSTYSDVFIAANKYENLESPSRFNITADNNKIIIVYPNTNTYMGIPQMNGMDIPMINSTFIYDNIQYNVLTSVNAYNNSLIITI